MAEFQRRFFFFALIFKLFLCPKMTALEAWIDHLGFIIWHLFIFVHLGVCTLFIMTKYEFHWNLNSNYSSNIKFRAFTLNLLFNYSKVIYFIIHSTISYYTDNSINFTCNIYLPQPTKLLFILRSIKTSPASSLYIVFHIFPRRS